MDDRELHSKACGYANYRKEALTLLMQEGKCSKRTKSQLASVWLAHYEGFREGYLVATSDKRYSTNSVKDC